MPLGKRHGFILELASDAGGRARMVVKGPCDAGGAGTAAPRTPTRGPAPAGLSGQIRVRRGRPCMTENHQHTNR